MIKFENGGVLIENWEEMPCVPDEISDLYLDFETSSNHPNIKSTNPWRRGHCTVIGGGITWDDHETVYFIPREFLLQENWLKNTLDRSHSWVNHSVKYDAHVAYNDLGIEFHGVLVCTLARAKILDSDRTFSGGYGLDALSFAWLGKDISPWYDALQPYLPTKGKLKNKDYGKIPIDILADYGCQDVYTNRDLKKYQDKEIPAECSWVVENETKLTSVLCATERRGMKIDVNSVKIELLKCIQRMFQIEDELEAKLGKKILPSSYDDVYDLLINVHGFPPIKKEGSKGEANFDKHILKRYETMGGDYAKFSDEVKLIREYRSQNTHKGLFWEAWLELVGEDSLLHSEYNQNVRTGRTSCKQPNSQQMDGLAKKQIRARKGYKLLCYDYSQQEYRWMASYLDNKKAIDAYINDPKTDYHQWVADVLCKKLVKRKPAKTLNFAIGFGAGKNKVLAMLSTEADIVTMAQGDHSRVRSLSLSVYNEYHKNLPELKRNQRMAESAVKVRGYARTVYGRRLRIPKLYAYKAFNNVVQCTAADTTKEAMTNVSEVFNDKLRDLDCHLLAVVHDEFLFEVPDDESTIEACHEEITRCLELPSARCKVPLIADRGEPSYNWKDAKGD